MQCQGCGSSDGGGECEFCSIWLCGRCLLNHAAYCGEIQKRKKRGEGPTVRQVPRQIPAPAEAPVNPLDTAIAAVKDLQDE
jgi:hypothetical protein